jgi:hypothetical protein
MHVLPGEAPQGAAALDEWPNLSDSRLTSNLDELFIAGVQSALLVSNS